MTNHPTGTQQQDTPSLVEYLHNRREALVLELRLVEKQLGIKPTVRALCPRCLAERNKAA